MSKWDIAIIAAFFISLGAVLSSKQLGLAGESFEVAKYICIGSFGVFTGKQIPSGV